MEIVFNIDGNYITNLAREWFYLEKKPYKKVEELLLSCMCGTSIDLRTLKGYVEDILTFKKRFIGKTRNNSFGLVDESPKIELPKYIQTKNIQTYYNRLKNSGIEVFYEYGFIKTNGEFIGVEWGRHCEWAYEYINKKYTRGEIIKLSQRGKYMRIRFFSVC